MFMQNATRFAAATAIPARTAAAPVRTGLVAGTLVETADGWCRVETLGRGDRVQSLDGGLCEVVAIDRDWMLPGEPLLCLPGGAFDNCSDLVLRADQHLLVDTLRDADLPDAALVLIPGAAFAGLFGTARRKVTEPVEVVTLIFAQEEVIYANSGVMLLCPGVAQGPGRLPQDGFFTRLDVDAGRALLCRQAGVADLPAPAPPAPAAARHATRRLFDLVAGTAR